MSKKGELLGLKDFDEAYSKENEDAFIKDAKEPEDKKPAEQQPGSKLPMFAQQTPGESGTQNNGGKESFGFSFIPQTQQ